MDFAGVLAELVQFLDRNALRFSMAGAFALHGYGIIRATSDVDLVVELRAQAAILDHMRALGYETVHVSEGFSNHVHPFRVKGRVDFLYVDERTADLLFARTRRLEVVPGVTAPVPRPEHIVAMKVQAMFNNPRRRLQEMADIQLLLGLPGIDVDEIRGYFEKYGLVERFDEIRQIGAPRP